MRWEDISADGEWVIPAVKREKGTAGALVLPKAALDIIKGQPRFASNPYVLAGHRFHSHRRSSKTQAEIRRQGSDCALAVS